MDGYLPRRADQTLAQLLEQLPAILVVGPRACGKTTTAQRLGRSVVRLDRDAEAAAFRADPDAALAGLERPVLLDEWQAVPGVVGAVKRAVDQDSRPGQFLLTGSVRADLEADTWPGTGRVVRLRMGTLTVGERLRRETRPLVDRLLSGDVLTPAADTPDLRGYLELAMASGFPEPSLLRAPSVRGRWLESYVDQLLTRDATTLEPGRDPARLRRYFEAYALSTAGVVTEATLLEAAGIDRRTAAAYERLLTNLLVVEALPAWSSNRLKRLVRTHKRHLADPGLLVGALGVDVAAVLREGDLLGRVLQTFVVQQIRTEAAFAETSARFYHLRTEQGRQEVDLLVEVGAGSVLGIEVKASAAPSTDDAKHLAWLRDQLGDRFVVGVVLHTGPRSFTLGDRLVAAPISTLWA
ncbi:MAG: DUF4143 domain-containing protein [Planctomycetaceae bacterium]|nr:DUF4143 domain-containing protein [Planctomycetaceae bacterium]